MNLTSALTAALAAAEVKQLGPRLARRALAYGLLALAILCLMVVAWRVLELTFGLLLGPLVAALLLALASAGVFYWLDRPHKKHPSPETASLMTVLTPVAVTVAAPLLVPTLKFLLHPKRVATLAVLASAAAAVGMVGKPTTPRRRPVRPS
ncbi:MAG: hypothetical protein DI628_05175 [Blastochloris viridis]|uniref:Uncharacterized protein n=1 Tax=Blastochloris viridis TaxID=1079 RepID=A0A6N4RFW2_BLAVI|nr:MAG: hypothetical protein DI628_05175 [Blastochloris viridis]